MSGVLEKDKIIKADIFVATTLDDISRKLSNLSNIHNDFSNLAHITSDLVHVNKEILDRNNKILKELTDERDEGEYLRREETASTTLTTYDIIGILGFPVKGYEIHNDGNNTILFAHNLTLSLIDPNVDTSNTRFSSLLSGDNIRFIYNRKIVRNIYLVTSLGTSAFRLWLIW